MVKVTRISGRGKTAGTDFAGSPPNQLLTQDSLLLLQGRGDGATAPTPQNDLFRTEARDFGDLTAEEQRQLRELQATDRRVRAHERAHQAAGGQYAGAASFEYEKGPDGQRYAVAGEVPIDVSPESDPQATIDKLEVVRRAALAPGDPSARDHAGGGAGGSAHPSGTP